MDEQHQLMQQAAALLPQIETLWLITVIAEEVRRRWQEKFGSAWEVTDGHDDNDKLAALYVIMKDWT